MKKASIAAIVFVIILATAGAVMAGQVFSPDKSLKSVGIPTLPWDESGNITKHTAIAGCEPTFNSAFTYLNASNEYFWQDYKIYTGSGGQDFQFVVHGAGPSGYNDWYKGKLKVQVTWWNKSMTNIIRKDRVTDRFQGCGWDHIIIVGQAPAEAGWARLIVQKVNDGKSVIIEDAFMTFEK